MSHSPLTGSGEPRHLAEHEVYDREETCDLYAHECVMVCSECGTEDNDHAEDCRGRGANTKVCSTHR